MRMQLQNVAITKSMDHLTMLTVKQSESKSGQDLVDVFSIAGLQHSFPEVARPGLFDYCHYVMIEQPEEEFPCIHPK